MQELLAETVAGICDPQPLPPFRRLEHVRLDAELDPWRRVAVRIEGQTLNLLQDPVVLARVPPQVWLDPHKLWTKESFLRYHQRLDDPCHTTVSLAHRVTRPQLCGAHPCA